MLVASDEAEHFWRFVLGEWPLDFVTVDVWSSICPAFIFHDIAWESRVGHDRSDEHQDSSELAIYKIHRILELIF